MRLYAEETKATFICIIATIIWSSVFIKRTYRFHCSGHIIISLSLFSQPGFLHQLLAVDHFLTDIWLLVERLCSGFWGWGDWYFRSQCSEILREPSAAAVPCCLSVPPRRRGTLSSVPSLSSLTPPPPYTLSQGFVIAQNGGSLCQWCNIPYKGTRGIGNRRREDGWMGGWRGMSKKLCG